MSGGLLALGTDSRIDLRTMSWDYLGGAALRGCTGLENGACLHPSRLGRLIGARQTDTWFHLGTLAGWLWACCSTESG